MAGLYTKPIIMNLVDEGTHTVFFGSSQDTEGSNYRIADDLWNLFGEDALEYLNSFTEDQFFEMDTDGDGEITKAEFEAWAEDNL